jgi:hypothetical protein
MFIYRSNLMSRNIDKKRNKKIKANPIAPRVYLVIDCFLMDSMRLRVCRANATPLPKKHLLCFGV